MTHGAYCVVDVTSSVEELVREVDQLLKDGWEPIGGIAFADFRFEQHWYQAMIKPAS